MNWPTFFTRLGSAIVFAAVMMCGLLWKDWMFVLLVAVIMVLCLRDYFRLMAKIAGPGIKWVNIALIAVGAVRLILLAFRLLKINASIIVTEIDLLLLGSTDEVLSIVTPILILLLAFLNKQNIWQYSFAALGSLFYIIGPAFLLISLRSIDHYLPLILILCIWTNDTMAYIVGSFIGKTPFSKISPKKTWEGTVGGALLTVVGAAVAAHFIPHQSMPLYIALALCAAIAGTAGDLFESKLKRLAGVKDSGTLMPGHGGALDRFDSLLVATPFAFCAVYLVQAFT